MNRRRRSSVRPRISLADVNYNHKSVLASLRAAISMTTVLLAGILDASIDHNDVTHCTQGPHHCTEENLDLSRLFREENKPRSETLCISQHFTHSAVKHSHNLMQ